jgi:VWFA-related protein
MLECERVSFYRAVFVFAVGLSADWAGQGLPSQDARPPVFRSTTRLVEISVVAHNHKGGPVGGLTRDDFEVSEGRERQQLAFFRFEGAVENRAVSRVPSQSLGFFTNRADQAPGPPRNVTAILLDLLNTAPQNNAQVRAQIVRYLKSIPSGSRVALFVLAQRLTVLHDFTEDFGSLRARLEKASLLMPKRSETDFNRAVEEAEEFLHTFDNDPVLRQAVEDSLRRQLRSDMELNSEIRKQRLLSTMGALEALGRHLSGIPGRKSLVWVSGGVSTLLLTGNFGIGPGARIEDLSAPVGETARRLAQEGIVLYAEDAAGLAVEANASASSSGSATLPGRRRAFEPLERTDRMASDPAPAMNRLTAITGGRYFKNTNDFSAGLSTAVTDVEGSYTLAFYASGEPDGKWHSLKVKVRRPGVSLNYRQGYFAEQVAERPTDLTAEGWRSLIASPVGSTAILLTAGCAATAGAKNSLDLELRVFPDGLYATRHGDRTAAGFTILIADMSPEGRYTPFVEEANVDVPASKWEAARTPGLAYTRRWKPAPGTTLIRIIVRDKFTGRYGTLDIPLSRVPPASGRGGG